MLILLPAKRDNVGLLDMALRFDLHRDTEKIGALIYDRKNLRGELMIGDQAYHAGRLHDQPDEKLYQAVGRLLTGGAKPPVNPTALTTATGEILALAEPTKGGFAVSHGGERFTLRRRSFFTRPYDLYLESSDKPLGSVGQARFFTRRLQMELPPRFVPEFQVFLVILLITLSFERMDSSN